MSNGGLLTHPALFQCAIDTVRDTPLGLSFANRTGHPIWALFVTHQSATQSPALESLNPWKPQKPKYYALKIENNQEVHIQSQNQMPHHLCALDVIGQCHRPTPWTKCMG